MKIETDVRSIAPAVVRGRGVRHAGAMLVLGALAWASAPRDAEAQRTERGTAPTTIDSMRADGSVVSKPLPLVTSGFRLFAGEDVACGTWRSTGQTRGGTLNHGGPFPNAAGGNTSCVGGLRGRSNAGGNIGWMFEMALVGGAPPSEWRKIRAVYPNARNMLGSPGYTGFYSYTVGNPQRIAIGAADGQFGKTFSGSTIAFDGSCRDDAFFNREGFSLMAMKDCPVTWGSEGYRGKLVVPDAVWRERFAASPNTFRWDDWSVPSSSLNATEYLGTQSLYGYMSDYYREQKLRFGSVVLGGAGAPSEQGYPLGIEFRVDAFQFGTPSVRNTQFYQLTLVNKSAEVYGMGVDYDSLYYGLGPGVSNQQNANAFYFEPQTGSVYIVRSGASGKCDATSYPKRYTGQTAGCNSTTAGFANGIMALTFLKSPLGDLRNKLFTQAGGPYFNAAHPNAGDTITYNHAAWGAFGNNNLQRSMRAAFGQVSNIESDYLDGRTPADLGAADYLIKFMPEEYSGVVPDAAGAKFNKFVPSSTTNPLTGRPFGRWDYDHDGVPDTISVPGCGRQGCHALWSDTIPGGYRNASWGNILNSLTAGPFKLKANDTTQFLWAFTHANDTLDMKQRIDNLLTSYLTNYEGPGAYPVPEIIPGKTYTLAAAEFVDSTRAGTADASVGSQITIRYPQINPADPFFLRAIAKIRQDSINNVGSVRRVLRLNPGLLDRLTARANDNIAAVYLFKSCDNGNTFTTQGGNSGTCTAAPTANIDAGTQQFAFRPIDRVVYINGVPQTAQFQEFVQAGRTYLYSLVTRSRGFSDFRVIDSTAAGLTITDVQNTLNITLDTISSPLATNGPSTINVYAPISQSAGRTFARVDTNSVSGRATQDLIVTNVSNSATGSTRLVFGNQFIVRKSIDSLTNAATTTVTVRQVLPMATTSPAGPTLANFIAREQTFTVNENIPVRSGTGLLAGTRRTTSGAARVFIDTITAVTNSVGYVWVTSDNKPIYVVDNQYAANFDRDQLSSPLYPGYTVRSRDSSNAASGLRQELLRSGTTRDRNYVIRAAGDTLQAEARQFTVQVQPIIASATANPNPKRSRGGGYSLTWLTDPWGPGAPFLLDPPGELQGKVNTSLTAVARLATTITDTSARFAAMALATPARPLVRVRVPFTMTFTDPEDGRVEQVRFAMLRRPDGIARTRLLGSGTDTLRVTVPDTLWMPGDTLYVIQKLLRDSTVLIAGARVPVVVPENIGGVQGFRPIQVLVDSIGLNKFLVACNSGAAQSGTRANTFDATTCNPLVINSRGATLAGGYLPVAAGWKQNFELTRTFDPRSVVQLVATPFTTGNEITKAALERVSVVPNPYIVRSDVDDLSGRTATAKIIFTGVPDQGILRIYSVSGQFLQELTWTASNLIYTGNSVASGDLPYNLRTREGIDLGSGLYLYVLTATGPMGKDQVQRGKFVVIR